MCGRITIATEPGELARAFGIAQVPAWLHTLVPRYNIAPSLALATVRRDPGDGRRSLAPLRWGLVPAWARDPAVGLKLINARSETVADKPAFRRAFAERRCLIPVTGFYEWLRAGKRRQPYLFRSAGPAPLALAGLWERWQEPEGDGLLETCTILTTGANALMAPIHQRMPVIIPAAAHSAWLETPAAAARDLDELLRPCPPEWLRMHPVDPRVNKPTFDEPACLEPWTQDPEPEPEETGAAAGDAPPRRQLDLFGGTAAPDDRRSTSS